MHSILEKLDTLLRGGGRGSLEALPSATDFSLSLALRLTAVLGGIYGACMGLFAVSGAEPGGFLQVLASLVKLPALYLLTLLVAFPALYVFSALAGSPLRFLSVLRLLLASIVVMVAVSASFAPILAFFTLSTSSYPFVVLLNVVLLGIAGGIGLRFLRRTLEQLMTLANEALPVDGRFPKSGLRSLDIFRIWLVIFALVGTQMGWLLRPFIGRPGLPFTFFRPRYGNVFQALGEHLVKLIGG